MLKIKLQSKYQGIIFILTSAFFFALMNLFVKLSGDIPTMQKVFFRNIVAFVCAAFMLIRQPSAVKTGKGNWITILLRAIIGTGGIICNFYAVDHMNIADASMLNKLSPFFAIIFSYFILKEKASKVDWIAVVIAFVGALFVIQPKFSMEAVWSLVGALGGLFAGLAYTLMRKAATNGASKQLIIFVFSAVSCGISAPFLIFDWHMMSWQQTLFILLAGVMAMFGQLAVTTAYTKAAAKELSVFDYSIVIFAGVLAFFVLDELPNEFSFIGYGIIILAAAGKWAYSMYKDKKIKENSVQDESEKSDDNLLPK